MTDDIEMYFEGVGTAPCYIESLIRSRLHLNQLFTFESPMVIKLEEVILAELELALLSAEKAKSEILKDRAKNISPLKGA